MKLKKIDLKTKKAEKLNGVSWNPEVQCVRPPELPHICSFLLDEVQTEQVV